jgi:hypothetical protein
MLPELFVLVVTTITPIQGTVNFKSETVRTPNLSQAECTAKQTAVYNNAVDKNLSVVVKCVRQD